MKKYAVYTEPAGRRECPSCCTDRKMELVVSRAPIVAENGQRVWYDSESLRCTVCDETFDTVGTLSRQAYAAKVAVLQAKIQNKLIKKGSNKQPARPAPRYDETYYKGYAEVFWEPEDASACSVCGCTGRCQHCGHWTLLA